MPLGVIAGSGAFPQLVMRAARAQGHDVAVVAIRDEAAPDLDRLAVELGGCRVRWLALGQLEECIRTFRDAGVSQAVMAGRVDHARLYTDLKPDPTLRAMLARVDAKSADPLLGAIAGVLAQHGIRVIDSTSLLSSLRARAGQLTARGPSEDMRCDFEFGYRIATESGNIHRHPRFHL